MATLAGTIAARPQGASLRVNFAWTSLAFAVYSACQWLVVAALAKFGSPEVVGRYSFGVAVATPVMMLAQLNLRSLLATDVRFEQCFRAYRNLRFLMLGLALLVISAWAGFLDNGGFAVLVGLLQAQEWVSDLYLGLLQREEKMARAAFSLMARALLGLAALAVVLAWTGSLAWALAAMLAARLPVLLFYDAGVAVRDCGAGGNSGNAAQLLRQALPLGIVLMLGALSLNMPRYFVQAWGGARELGIFTAVFSLATAGHLVINALGQSATPRLARYFAEARHTEFARLAGRLALMALGFGALGLAGAALAGPAVLRLAYRPEYAAWQGLLLVAMCATTATFAASMLGYVITAARRFRQQVPLQIASLLSTALACWLLTPRFGLAGSAAAVAAGALVQLALEACIVRGILREMRRAEVRS